MTKRKPLTWDGGWPLCEECMELLVSSGFVEACASVAIEHATSAGTLARRTVNEYHARRHPAEMAPVDA
ncbi:MAG TPA: hypothetical protein VK453_25480 [Micromonosporaceae bacterium]|nr:hypothetical protein [Micromonosporaceae bacterium]